MQLLSQMSPNKKENMKTFGKLDVKTLYIKDKRCERDLEL